MARSLFPSILPSPDTIPASFRPSGQLVETVTKALEAAPHRAALIEQETSVREFGSLAALLALHTDALKELAVRSGGNPFDNTDTQYAVLMQPLQANRDPPVCVQTIGCQFSYFFVRS